MGGTKKQEFFKNIKTTNIVMLNLTLNRIYSHRPIFREEYTLNIHHPCITRLLKAVLNIHQFGKQLTADVSAIPCLQY